MAIPKEPRQLMINLMYLVLTAMLALNVSAEIFNAFKLVDKGLKKSNVVLDTANDRIPAEVARLAKKEPKRLGKYTERTGPTRELAKVFCDSIDAVVTRLKDFNGDGIYDDEDDVIKLDENGEVIWSNKIGKNNRKANVSIYSSYYPIMKNENLFLLYNCNDLNLNHKTGLVTNSFHPGGKWAFIATQVNDYGNYERMKLADKEQLNGITIRPSLYNWVDYNTLLMFGQDIDNLKNQGFVKINFNE